MKIKSLPSIIVMNIGLDSESIIWEHRWKYKIMVVSVHMKGKLISINVTDFYFL